MLLNDNIVEIEKRDEISSVTSVVGDFSELFLHSSTFLIENSRSVCFRSKQMKAIQTINITNDFFIWNY